MAVSKKNLDEEYLKSLREMASLPHNRQCFECSQRGPTYINMTIGSFVCMTCSGLLRGLNPPHRVKSISMASFTAEEMDFVRSRGNDFCRKVWLGLQNSQPFMPNDAQDEHRIQDSMSEKYEKKRWYVPPQETMYEEARKQNMGSDVKQASGKTLSSMIGNSPSILSTPDGQGSKRTPLQHSSSIQRPSGVGRGHLGSGAQLINSLPSPRSPKDRSPSSQSTKPASFDLLSDLGEDLFTSPSPPQQSDNCPAFAAFNSAQPVATLTASSSIKAVSQHPTVTMATLSSPPPAAADKYSALAELDGVFSSSSASTKVNWESSSPVSAGSRSGSSWVASSPSAGLPPGPGFPFGGFGGSLAGSNPFGMAASSVLYNPFAGNLIMTPGYSHPVATGFSQFGLPQQSGMRPGYGQLCGMPVATGFQYGFPNGVGVTGGNTWAGKVSTPVGGLPDSSPSGWSQPSMGINPFLNTSPDSSNTLNPFM